MDSQRANPRPGLATAVLSAVVLAACADTPEFTGAEKKWLSDNLPDKTFASADEVVASLHL
jgi:hypothetical protein